MTDPQHLQQLIQVEDERVETLLKCVVFEAQEAYAKVDKLSADSTDFGFLESNYRALKHHLTRRDTLRELLNK